MGYFYDLTDAKFLLDINTEVKFSDLPPHKQNEIVTRFELQISQLKEERDYLKRLCIAQATEVDPETKF